MRVEEEKKQVYEKGAKLLKKISENRFDPNAITAEEKRKLNIAKLGLKSWQNKYKEDFPEEIKPEEDGSMELIIEEKQPDESIGKEWKKITENRKNQ